MNSKERFKLIPSVYLLLVRDGRILLSRRFQTGFKDGEYGLPAGHAEEHETMREALKREVMEEIGVEIQPEDLEHIVTMHVSWGDHERIDLFFTVKDFKGEIKNMEPEKCDDLQWFPLDKLPPNTIEYIKAAIGCFLEKKTYLEFGWKEE